MTARRERDKRSWVWRHFGKEAGSDEAICQECDQPVRIVKGNTTILAHHLRKEHGILPPGEAATHAATCHVCERLGDYETRLAALEERLAIMEAMQM